MFCQTGLHYNDRIHFCDYPENVDCRPGNPEVPGNPEEQPEVRPEPRCQGSDPHNPTKLPHDTDCNKFWVCDGALAVRMSCPSGTHWNRNQHLCDFPEAAGCQSRRV